MGHKKTAPARSGHFVPEEVPEPASDLYDLVGLEARGADLDVLNGGVQNRLDADDVCLESSLGAHTDVLTSTTLLFRLTFARDIVAGHGSLSANFTFSGHNNTPS